MIKENGIITALSWVKDLLLFSPSRRKKMRKLALESLKKFKQGKESDEGIELVRGLEEEAEFIGFVPNVSYVKEMAKDAEDLSSIFVHPFGSPTLLYKVKGKPILLLTNANLEYNKSKLEEIPHNKYQKKLMNVVKNTLGITG